MQNLWKTKAPHDKPMDISALSEDAMICYCKKVTKRAIKEAFMQGATTLKEVSELTGACKSSEFCHQMNPNQRCCAIDIIATINYYKDTQ